MMFRICFWCFIEVLFCQMFCPLITPLVYAVDYEVQLLLPPITDHVVLPTDPLPPVCSPLADMNLYGCRGQALPASFVITVVKPLQNVRIEAAQVRGGGHSWPATAVDIHVVKDYYRNTIAAHRATMPTLLVHDESFLAIDPAPTKDYPDRMANVARGPLRDADSLQPVDISQRKQFWVTIHIPDKAKPGHYETTLRIVPQNSEATAFRLSIEVHPFELLPPMIEYSIYYPAYLEASLPADSPHNFGNLSAQQMLAEFRNMHAHGLDNPNIYDGPAVKDNGDLDFSKLDRILDLREQAGLRPRVLYLISPQIPRPFRPLTDEEHQQVKTRVVAINAWAQARGYDEVFLAMHDESWGENLTRERHSMIAIEEAGGSTFVAVNHPPFYARVGDVLTRPVLKSSALFTVDHARKAWSTQEGLRHMDEIGKAGSFTLMAENPGFREAIDGMHRQGRKIFTYMNPMSGFPLPDLHRRNTGLGMWRVGFDGTMTWAYTHIMGDKVNQQMIYGMVYRTENDVVDTLHWEGFREGVYDVRYLTTLMARLSEAAGRFPDDPIVEETWKWLRLVDVANGDLDAIRLEMARRIVALQDLGFHNISPEELFSGIDLDAVRLTTIPEPWRFKPDPDNDGVGGKWFEANLDITLWDEIRTNQDAGWNPQLFGKDNAGYGWYRTALPVVEADLEKKYHYLFFGAVDEDCWVYLNGQSIFDHSLETTGLIPAQIWMVPFTVPLAGLDLHGGDALAVRVKNTNGMGGVWKPVQLVASDQPLTSQQILALVKIRKPNATP